MMRLKRSIALLVLVGLATGICSRASAVPYASFVHETGTPDLWEFVLNDAADNVTVLRDGGNALNLGGLAAGRHTFDMTGFGAYEIKVAKNETAPTVPNTLYREITSGTQNSFTKYERASDVIVNSDPASPNFGVVYVNSVRNVATAAQTTPPIPSRTMGDGIYALTGNLIGVDLPTKAILTDPNDASAAKSAANWQLGDQTVCNPSNPSNCQAFLGTASGWRMSFDEDNNILMGDWSDSNGGIKWINPNLTSGGLLLKFQDGVFQVDGDGAAGPNPPERIGLIPNGEGEEVHGSIPSHVYATGSVGNGLTVYAMDEDYDLDGNTFNTTGNTGNHVWKWNVGNATGTALDGSDAYDQPPELVINTSSIPDTTGTVKDNWLSLNAGVQSDAVYSAQHNKWYLTENRDTGNEAGLVVVTPDGGTGNSPVLEWSSMQFTIDNGLDGNNAAAATGIQDAFRSMFGGMTLSEDGTKLIVHRRVRTDNPVLGNTGTSSAAGSVLIIPLDENGVPDLTVSGGQITNIGTIVTGSDISTGLLRGVNLDAAGNFYTTNNTSEKLQVFTPLGNFLAVTRSDGTFDVSLVEASTGDYNGDGLVDAADYVAWRKNPGANGGDPDGYDDWYENFGETVSGSGGGGSNGAVPEPGSALLAVLGMLISGGCRRRQA